MRFCVGGHGYRRRRACGCLEPRQSWGASCASAFLGTYVESKTKDDPDASDRLLQGLDGFLARPRDRELFGLPQREEEAQ